MKFGGKKAAAPPDGYEPPPIYNGVIKYFSVVFMDVKAHKDDPDGFRTHSLKIRSLTHYPIMLQGRKVPARIELALQDSESYVLTIILWNQKSSRRVLIPIPLAY